MVGLAEAGRERIFAPIPGIPLAKSLKNKSLSSDNRVICRVKSGNSANSAVFDIALGGADAMITSMSLPELPDRECKRGHTGAWTRNAQGALICTKCKNERARARYESSQRRLKPAAVLPSVTPVIAQQPSVAARGTFLQVAQEWIAAQDNVAPRTAIKRAYLLAQLSALHGRQISTLETPDFVKTLKEIESEGDKRETAHRAGMLAGQITRYAVNHGYMRVNPLPSGQLRGSLKPVKTQNQPAITDPKRFGRLLRGIMMYELFTSSRNHPSVSAALLIAPYLFVRPGELRTMEWSEVDLDKGEWVIPEAKTKMRRKHLVPLSRQAIGLLREQRAKTGSGRFVYPAKARTSARKGAEQPVSENGFGKALRAVLGSIHEPLDAHVMHGFRSSASTMLKEQLGYDSEIVELQLAHAKKNRVAGIYDRSQRVEERRALMQKWSDYIDGLREAAGKEK